MQCAEPLQGDGAVPCSLSGGNLAYWCVYAYHICPNRSPGLYFFPDIFDPACIRAQLLLKFPDFLFEPSTVSNIKCVVNVGAAWPPVKVCARDSVR